VRDCGRAEVWIVLLVAVVLGGTIVWATQRSDGPSNDANRATTTTVTSTPAPALPEPMLYKVTDGVNVRTGPSTSFAIVTQVELGREVLVVCQIEGQTVDGPRGPTNRWLRVSIENKTGYVTAQYVDTRGAIQDLNVIGNCPAA
jgi:uncharacterized protein YraI